MPYANVPENLWPKMDSCVESVMQKQGLEKGRAVAICHAQIVGDKSLDEDMLVAYGGSIKAGNREDDRHGAVFSVRLLTEPQAPEAVDTRDGRPGS